MLCSAVGDEQGVRLSPTLCSLGAGDAVTDARGVCPLLPLPLPVFPLAFTAGAEALGFSGLAFLAALLPAAGVGAFRFFFPSSAQSSASAAAPVLTVSCSLGKGRAGGREDGDEEDAVSAVFFPACCVMKASRQPQSNIRCSAALLVRQRYSSAEKASSRSSIGKGAGEDDGADEEEEEEDDAAALMAAVLAT
jgi:hypothetical protein